MQTLAQEIKELIISALTLEDIQPEDIDPDMPLFVEGLGLDSIDALELGLALQRTYGVTMSSDSEQTRQHFRSINTLATFVAQHRNL